MEPGKGITMPGQKSLKQAKAQKPGHRSSDVNILEQQEKPQEPELASTSGILANIQKASSHDFLHLQRTLGNKATTKLIQQAREARNSRPDLPGVVARDLRDKFKASGSHHCTSGCLHGGGLQRQPVGGSSGQTGPVLNSNDAGTVQRGFFDRFSGNKKSKPDTGATLTAPVTSTVAKPKTEKELFLEQKFTQTNFTPKTGIGNFDTTYDPATGQMEVILKLHFEFADMTDAAYMRQAKASERKWAAAKKKEWVKEFKESVLSVWGSMPPVECNKPGFEGVMAVPKMVIKDAPTKDASNYNVKVSKSFMDQTSNKLRTAGGATSVDYKKGQTQSYGNASFQEFDNKDKINDPRIKDHLSKGEQTGNITPAYKLDRARLVKSASEIPPILFEPNSGTLAPGMDDALKEGVKKLADLKKSSALTKLHPLIVKITTIDGEGADVIIQRMQVIKRALAANGVEQPTRIKNSAGASPSTSLEAAPEEASVTDQYLQNWKRITVAHEVGHMLGLLDEYCHAASPELLQKMVNEGQLSPGYTMSGKAAGVSSDVKGKQTGYAQLLDDANLPAQDWTSPESGSAGDRSTSLMSGGFELLTQHYVTIWEALGKMTEGYVKKNEWKLG